MAQISNFLIRWDVDWDPKNATVKMEQVFRNIDERIFHDPKWMESFWHDTARQIGKFVKEKFDKKEGWPPLSTAYLDWKNKAVERGYKVQAGAFGKRLAKFTEMGKLTGVLINSATKRGKYANEFEVLDSPQYEGGTFRYSIDLTQLPYAKPVHAKRPFFYLDPEEGLKVMKALQPRLIRKLHQLWRLG